MSASSWSSRRAKLVLVSAGSAGMAFGRESETRWVCVARVDDVPVGQVRSFEADGWKLALVNRDRAYYALWAICPHRGGPLDQGVLWHGMVECPWHHFRFDPATGANVYPACVYPEDMTQLKQDLGPARVFPLEVRDDQIFVELPPPCAPEPPGGGPHKR